MWILRRVVNIYDRELYKATKLLSVLPVSLIQNNQKILNFLKKHLEDI